MWSDILPRSPWSDAIRLTDSQRTKHSSPTWAAHDGQRNDWWRVTLSWDWITLSTSHLNFSEWRWFLNYALLSSASKYIIVWVEYFSQILETSTSTNHGSCSLICQVWLSFPIMCFILDQCVLVPNIGTVIIKPPSTSLVFSLSVFELWRLPRLPIFLKVHKLCLQFWWKHKLAPIFPWEHLTLPPFLQDQSLSYTLTNNQ